jgi:hypothetical protein
MRAESSLTVAKNSVKRPKNSVKKDKSSKPPMSDIAQIKSVANLLLGRLEITIRKLNPVNPKKPKGISDPKIAAAKEKETKKKETKRKKQYKEIFGDGPCVDNLVTLADIMLKLEKAESNAPPMQENYFSSPELTMNAADMALVENFVERVRGSGD